MNQEHRSDLGQQAKGEVEAILTLIQDLPSPANLEADAAARSATPLNAALSFYEAVPVCRLDPVSRRWIYPMKPSQQYVRRWVRGERQATARILKLAGMGLLGRVRKCKSDPDSKDKCEQYFFARDETNLWHSKACWEKWERSEQRKQEKAEKARDTYYASLGPEAQKKLDAKRRRRAAREGP